MNAQNAGGVRQRPVETALDLTQRLPHVHAVHVDAKGRGRALKHVWSRSGADVVAYMDVDLSTGLEGFLPLFAPLLSGHGDLATGQPAEIDDPDSRVDIPAAPAPPPLSCPSGRPPLPRNTWSTRHDDPRPAPGQESARRSHRAGPPADGGLNSRARRLFTGPADDPAGPARPCGASCSSPPRSTRGT